MGVECEPDINDQMGEYHIRSAVPDLHFGVCASEARECGLNLLCLQYMIRTDVVWQHARRRTH